MSESIAAVVVTYNRKALLAECVASLMNQTRKPDRIYVIDQASTDGTEKLFSEEGILSNSLIDYRRSGTNSGGAGGFCDGMKIACQDGHAWMWLMDDDAIPNPDALEKMLNLTFYPRVVAIANRVVKLDGAIDVRHKSLAVEDESHPAEYARVNYSSFVGLLVSRRVTEKIGFPKKELFFQYDDNEYCSRLIASGDIAYAGNSVIVHKEERSAVPQKGRYWLKFFAIRNRLWWITRSGGPKRNLAVLRYVLFIGRETLRALFDCDRATILRLKIIYRAVLDGLVGRFDNEYPFIMKDRLASASRPAKDGIAG